MSWAGRTLFGIIAIILLGAASNLDGPGNMGLGRAMRFVLLSQGRCEGHCSRMLVAEGLITAHSAERFRRVARTLPPGTIVTFRSEGGNLLGAIGLGMAIRDHRFSTFVADGTDCTSACAFAFLGGAKRSVHPGGRFGIHRFSSWNRDTGQREWAHEQESADEFDNLLSDYVWAMRGSPLLVTLAKLVDPSAMRYLTPGELLELAVVTQP